MSTPVTTYDKRPVIVSSTAPTSLEQLKYLWLDISETTSVLRYYNATTETWEAINDVDTSSFLTTNGVQTITGAKTFNAGTITVADITVDDVTIEGIDTIKLTDSDTHIPTSKLVEDTLASAISGLENNKQDKLLYYSEISGDAPSATISVANIKLTGSVAEGDSTAASGLYSHAEGINATASGPGSHAEGSWTTASGTYSHAEGRYTIASSEYQHAQGKFNIEDANDKYADIIGNGSSSSARSNAATVSWDGITWSQTDVRAGGTDQDAATHSLAAKQNATDNSLTTTAKTIPGAINELKTATDAMVVVSTDNAINVAPTTAQTGVLIASSKTNGGNVIITPKITNTGACYLSTSSTYSNLNPIYPDPTNNKYTYPNLGAVYLFVDNAGDSADIVIENFAG